MDETPNPFETFPAIAAISELLSQSAQMKFGDSAAGVCEYVPTMKTEEFATLSDFKEAYLACKQPVLCFVRPSEVHDVLSWLRESDDIAVEGEAESLIQWRLDRITTTFAKRLDPLTQVHRRGELIRTLEPICHTAGPDQPVSLILMDIDHLKLLNDRLGIQVGDEVLSKLGRLIQTLCHKTFVARTRGGEFGVIVKGVEALAKTIAATLRQSIEQENWCNQPDITASFGVASVVENCDPSKVLTQADEALFAAKANGRNKVVCYSEIASVSNRHEDELEVVSMENKARVLSERVTSFVTQRSKRIMQSLRREANTDGLTQLFNRRYLDKQLDEELKLAIESNNDLCVALIDLDHFGIINKQHGWPTGDKVLRGVAATIMQNIRGSDWVARYGGEEICIVMPGTRFDSAMVVCERIRNCIEAMFFESTSGAKLSVTLSIGVVGLDPKTDPTAESLIERVSQLTLKAKTEGRNRVQG